MQQNETKTTNELAAEADDSTGSLTVKQERALQALLSHRTLKEAALAAGISETTLWRYMKDEAFLRRLREAERDALTHISVRFHLSSSDADTILHDLMMKEETPASARISAVRTVLDYSIRLGQLNELNARMEQLEEFIKRKQEEDILDAAKKESED
jgi:DNA-binding CsgD family transcriptional regulator